MNLLFLASWYPETVDSRNGLFIWRHAEAAALDARHQVALVAAVKDVSVNRTEIRRQTVYGVEHFIAYYPGGGPGWWRAWSYLWALHQAIRFKEKTSGKSDLMVVNVLWRTGILAWLYQIFLNRPYIIIEHWSGYLPEGQGYKGYYLKHLTRLIADRAERILTVSDYLADSMRKLGLNNRYHVLPNVVDTDVFHPSVEKDKDLPPYLLHVSNLATEKNFDFVLALWQALRSTWPDLELRVAGAYKAEDQKPYLGIAGIHWLGFQEGQVLAGLYQRANALCMPSHFETFSIVIAEALACGCPVLANDLPTFEFYKVAHNFYALPVGDLPVWLSTVQTIKTMEAQNDYDFIHNGFSMQKVSKKMLGIIEGVGV
jgi:glycosyltransferase involved in cell wall biosynthesis